MSSYYSTNKETNERIIYVIVANGELVMAYADEAMAKADAQKLRAFKPGMKISPPIAVKFKDSMCIDSKGFNRVQFVG